MTNITVGGQKFDITYEQLGDILVYITDEFPQLTYDVDGSIQSSLIFTDYFSFVITFQEQGAQSFFDLEPLHYLEPKIFKLIELVNSQLEHYNLYVSASDFGESDAYYELVISEIGWTPKYRERYAKTLENSTAGASTSGMGGVSCPGVSSTSVSSSSPGSGDPTFTLTGKPKGKMGLPSEVSDLRFLKGVKIKRVKDF
jgi:hypothetical protein